MHFNQLLRVMHLTAIALTVCCLQVSATAISQKISLTGKNMNLNIVLDEVRRQSGYYVFYNQESMSQASPVNIDMKEAPLTEFLDSVFKRQPFSYSITKTTIIVKKNIDLEVKPTPNIIDELDAPPVSGIIRDADGNPIAGVNVVVKGTRRGITTDAQGKFSIEAKENDVLVISSIGYNAREIKVTSLNVPHIIALDKSVSQLDEVQYIAYGTTSKRFSTSNTTTITAKDIEKQPVNNPLLALQGRVPGMTIMQSNGIPGGGITVRIQGRNNLDHNLVGSDPFIVIDGVPYASQNLKTFLGGDVSTPILGSSANDDGTDIANYGNPLSYINPADIESISVLRDADATAIYGSRAANGAILITTKRGKQGAMKTDINLQQGWGKVPKKIPLLNSQQYMEMRWEGKRNDGRPVTATDYDLRGVWDTTRYTDWQDELIGGTAEYSRLTAGVSGGTNNLQYLVSSTYGRETTVFPGNFANSFGSLHFNLSATSNNQRFKMQLGGSYMANNNKLPGVDYTQYALNLPPVAPALYNSDGTLNWAPNPETGNSTWFNPLLRQYYLFETKANNLVSNGSISYRIIPGLELRSTFGFTSTSSDQFVAATDESEKPEFRNDRFRVARFSFNTSRTWIVEPQIIWQQRWGYHSLNILCGTTFQYQDNDGRGFTTRGQTNDLLLRNMLGGTRITGGVDIYEYKYNAIFGRINYILKEKYLLNLSARRDGSSRFGPKSQFNNFGAVGVGWNLSEEPFFKSSLPFISFAKIRGSYGTTGNDQIGNYMFMNLYASYYNEVPYQGSGASSSIELPNPYLEWEETRKVQGGIDLGLWKDKVLITANFYRNRTSNSLTFVNLPGMVGYPRIATNLPALIQNTGWEFTVSGNKKIGGLNWNTNLNLTIPRNKVVDFPGLETSPLNYIIQIGQPLSGVARIPSFSGVDPLTGVYMVINRYGKPTTQPGLEDLTVFTNTNVKYYGGWQHSISYKGISLDFLIQFTRKEIFDVAQFGIPGRITTRDPYFISGNQPAWIMERWQKPGDIASIQRFSSTGIGLSVDANYNEASYKDGSFARLKNVSVSYNVPGDYIQKLKMQSMRVFVNAQNLLTFTRYRGLDPETLGLSSLPPLRMITAGIQTNF